MRVMRQVRSRDYFYRHLYNFFPHLTLKKAANLALNTIEKRNKTLSPYSLPPYIKVEPTPLCQLKCPGCNHTTSSYKKKTIRDMQISLEDFKKIIDPMSHHLLGISLSLHGEPLLHEEISSLIEYAHKKNIAVSFPTNLSVKLKASTVDGLVKSGLDSILVSLDGASEETYGRYRIGGDFSLVLSNVKSLSDAKKKYALSRPKIIWKFVVFDYNQHEKDIVKKTYRDLNFDGYEFVQDFRSKNNAKFRRDYKDSLRKSGKGCFWLWNTMIINWDGEVSPCCTNESFDIGNAIHKNIIDIWRSDAYRELRNGFSDKENHSELNAICKKCMGIP